MTTLQVHLLMLGLGILAYLLLAGIFSNRRSHLNGVSRQWWLGAIAGIAVALSPFSRFLRVPANGIELLTQSLLISAICLLCLLVFALIRTAFRAMRKRARDNVSVQRQPQNTSGGHSPIVINADSSHAVQFSDSAATRNASEQYTFEKPRSNAVDTSSHSPNVSMYNADTYTDPLRDTSDKKTDDKERTNASVESKAEDASVDKTIYADDDQSHTIKLDAADIESVVPMHGKPDGTHRLDDTISRTNAANDITSADKSAPIDPFENPINDTLLTDENQAKPTLSVEEESLDLSETEQLFAEIRSQRSEVELPDDKELHEATMRSTMDELDLETELITDELVTADNRTMKTEVDVDLIEEAEVLDGDDANLEFGNDLTGEYAHPSEQSSSSINFVDNNTAEKVRVPETLDDALIAAKVSAFSLQAQVSKLEDSIVELDGLHDNSFHAAKETIDRHSALLEMNNNLLSSEDEARQAAESVIAAQSALIDQAKRQQVVVESLLKQERRRLALLEQEVDRSRKMARTAAHLARKAAVAQQTIRNVAKREQTARLKSQESTRKAVTIARNAINALAAEERKHSVTGR